LSEETLEKGIPLNYAPAEYQFLSNAFPVAFQAASEATGGSARLLIPVFCLAGAPLAVQ
jgi:hypothetical protein